MNVLLATFPAVTLLRGGVEVQVRSLTNALGAFDMGAELFDPWKRYDLREYGVFHLFGAHVGTYHLGRAARDLGARLALSPVYFSRRSPARVRLAVRLSRALRGLGGAWTEQMFCSELCTMAHHILPNSRAEMQLLQKGHGLSADRMTLLPNGVDERYSRATPDLFESRYGVRDFILYVGHIGWERKNLLRLISAVRALSRPLVLMGPVVAGRYAAACLELAGATPGALVVPGVAPDDPLLQSAYAACDTLVLPSYYETPGLAALEAALAGAKVCVTRYGGTDEYFGVHAEYLEPRSEASIRDAVARSLAKEKTGLLREHVMTNFTWGRVAGGLAGIYRRLADSARP